MIQGTTAPGVGARILVVEDDRDSAECLRKLLALFEHEVQVVGDGPRAIEAALSWRPDFILLDIGLPGMDGFQVAARLRRESSCRQTVIIAVTSHGRPEDRRQAQAVGIDDHLVKPVDLDILLSALRRFREDPARSKSSAQDAVGGAQASPDRPETPVPWAGDGSTGMPTSRTFGEGPGPGTQGDGMDQELSSGVMAQGIPQLLVICRHVEITNPLGLHLRAADRFVRLARQFQADVRVGCDGRKTSGRSMLDLMMLAAPCGCRLELEADGPDAEAAVDALIALVERGFDGSDQ